MKLEQNWSRALTLVKQGQGLECEIPRVSRSPVSFSTTCGTVPTREVWEGHDARDGEPAGHRNGTRNRPIAHVSGVLGMPLLHVSAPTFSGARRAIKNVIDRVGAVLMLALTAPIMLITALAIAVDSRGPVFFTMRRVGKDGKEFTMVKFRTLVTGEGPLEYVLGIAEADQPTQDKTVGGLEVTHVGAFLRRYSIDELPQLFNVLMGSMSLVGPRPPFPDEIAGYAPNVRRRLLVKPGLTGLWQVSGRSDLPWEEAVRLDLQYVEDWSLTLDAMIIWKTVRAVLGGKGAY